MKRIWELEELIESFTLETEETQLWNGKEPSGQLGLAVLLKFFQYEGRFSYYAAEMPGSVITYIAEQLGIGVEQYLQYDHNGRRSKRDRMMVREYRGSTRIGT